MNWRGRFESLAESPRKTLQLFAFGAALFFAGLGIVSYVDHVQADSLQAELLVVLAIVLMSVGFMLAIFGQVLFIRQRFRS